MRISREILFILVLLLLPWQGAAFAAKKSPGGELNALREEMTAIRQEMAAMRERYETTTARLEERVAGLASASRPPGGAGGPSPAADERERLRQAAAGSLGVAVTELETTASATPAPSVTFKAGELGLQALNPEISFTGDAIAQFRSQDQVRENARGTFRSLGVHGECYLDPQTRFKTAFPITETGTELGEAYITRVGFSKDLNLTLGKFHQQFGTVSRWHQHALDQVDFPLALRRLFGGPLNQIGVSFDWQLPSGAGTGRELTMQVTNVRTPVNS